MICDTNTTEQRHGLGLLIVKQIIKGHNGEILIGHSEYDGFKTVLIIPKWIYLLSGMGAAERNFSLQNLVQPVRPAGQGGWILGICGGNSGLGLVQESWGNRTVETDLDFF